MLDRIHWEDPKEKPARCLSSKIDVRIDLTPETPGQRTDFEEALRILFPGGWTRHQARWFFREAAKAVSRAVIHDQRGFFPMDVELVWPESPAIGPKQPAPLRLVPFSRNPQT